MAGILDTIRQKQGDTQKSASWYRNAIGNLRSTPTARKLMNQGRLNSRPSAGRLNLFFYDPKTKNKLPYYDRFPLTIPVEPADGGFRGINLHYLPPVLRAKFLDALLNVTNNKKYDDTTKFRLTYRLLKGARNMRYFKPCLKHYLLEHVRSRFAEVPAPEWEIATFLPTAQWTKASAGRVYQDSRKAING